MGGMVTALRSGSRCGHGYADRPHQAADGFTDRHQLVHVKAADRSAPLSHLFGQGLVSIQELILEPEARDGFSARVAEISDGLLTAPPDFTSRTVVFAILFKGRELTPETLFPFARVALVTAADTLRRDYNVDVEVVGIPFDESSNGSSDVG